MGKLLQLEDVLQVPERLHERDYLQPGLGGRVQQLPHLLLRVVVFRGGVGQPPRVGEHVLVLYQERGGPGLADNRQETTQVGDPGWGALQVKVDHSLLRRGGLPLVAGKRGGGGGKGSSPD